MSHAEKMAAMFGGSGLHHGQQEEVAPVKRNFVLPRKVSLVELTEAAEVRAPAPTPPANPHAGQVVVESLSGVGGWAAKFGSGKQKTPPTVRRRRGSVDDLTGAVTSGQGVERNMPKSPSANAPPSKIFDPSTGVVRTTTRPLTVVAGSAQSKSIPAGANRTISFTSDGMVHHSDDEDNAPAAKSHPRLSVGRVEHKAPVAAAKAAASPKKPSAGKYGGGVIGQTNITQTPKPAAANTNFSMGAKAKSASKWGAPMGPKCPVCDKSVFKMEEVLIEGVHFHKWCCRCSVDTCNKRLTAGKYASYKGAFYCKPCFMKAFKEKGNYDEGFGHAQRKLDWTSPEKAVNLAAETDM